LISYFKVDDAKSAFNHLLEQKEYRELPVAYVYDDQVAQTLLTSINEFSDSSKSDSSQENILEDDKQKSDIIKTKPIEEQKATKIIENKHTQDISNKIANSPQTVGTKYIQNQKFNSPISMKDLNKTLFVDFSESSLCSEAISEGYFL